MTILLVTGGAESIGSHTTEAWLDRGDTVVCLDHLNDYYAPHRKRDCAALVEELVAKKANVVSYPVPPGDVPRTCAGMPKAPRLLTYVPGTPFAEGVARFFDWYRVEVARQ